MKVVSKKANPRAINADNIASKLDLTMVGSDWRTGEGLNPKGEYRQGLVLYPREWRGRTYPVNV